MNSVDIPPEVMQIMSYLAAFNIEFDMTPLGKHVTEVTAPIKIFSILFGFTAFNIGAVVFSGVAVWRMEYWGR